MRTIEFRGKRAGGPGKWVYGGVWCDKDGEPHIVTKGCDFETVIPSTIGQYTGLTDKKGNKVFEGDILHDTINNCFGIVKFGDYASAIGSDKFTHHQGFYVDWRKGRTAEFSRADLGFWFAETDIVQIVGNIYDNQGLLES